MAIVIIQPNAKTIYLRLWKYEINGKKSGWIKKEFNVPYEPLDTRFRSVCHYLDDGWQFFKDKESPTKGHKAFKIPLETLEDIKQDKPTIPETTYSKIDFSKHWREVDRLAKLEAQKPKGLQKTASDLKYKLLQHYKKGGKLKPYQLAMIKDLL